MGLARVEMRYTTVLKDYKDHPDGPARWRNEITAYTTLDWATPKLHCHGEYWLEMERLTPILELAYDQTRRYRDPLRELVQAVHDAGYWHCDIALVNVVIHPVRGPLLIDWENLRPATGPVSYDLYGARAAGTEVPWPVKDGRGRPLPDDEAGNGIYWRGPWDICPGRYWNVDGSELA